MRLVPFSNYSPVFCPVSGMIADNLNVVCHSCRFVEFFRFIFCYQQTLHHFCLYRSLIISFLLISLPSTSLFTRSHSQPSTFVKRCPEAHFQLLSIQRRLLLSFYFLCFFLSFSSPHLARPTFSIFCFMRFLFILWFTLEQNWFSLMFFIHFHRRRMSLAALFTLLPHLRPNAFVHTYRGGLFEDNIIQNTSRFSESLILRTIFHLSFSPSFSFQPRCERCDSKKEGERVSVTSDYWRDEDAGELVTHLRKDRFLLHFAVKLHSRQSPTLQSPSLPPLLTEHLTVQATCLRRRSRHINYHTFFKSSNSFIRNDLLRFLRTFVSR